MLDWTEVLRVSRLFYGTPCLCRIGGWKTRAQVKVGLSEISSSNSAMWRHEWSSAEIASATHDTSHNTLLRYN
jgi:hypothetical protein